MSPTNVTSAGLPGHQPSTEMHGPMLQSVNSGAVPRSTLAPISTIQSPSILKKIDIKFESYEQANPSVPAGTTFQSKQSIHLNDSSHANRPQTTAVSHSVHHQSNGASRSGTHTRFNESLTNFRLDPNYMVMTATQHHVDSTSSHINDPIYISDSRLHQIGMHPQRGLNLNQTAGLKIKPKSAFKNPLIINHSVRSG